MIKNRNGKSYEILEQKGNIMLLVCLDLPNDYKGYDKFVVCKNFSNDSWESGDYFKNLSDSKKYFDEIT